MALVPYRRGARWSSVYALGRIEAKARVLSSRQKEITREVERLLAEQVMIAGIEAQLVKERETETARLAAKAGRSSGQGDLDMASETPADEEELLPDERGLGDVEEGGLPPSGGPGPDEGSSSLQPEVARAGSGGSIERYDSVRCLFLGPEGFRGGSTHVAPVDRADPVFEDPLIARAFRIIETPGLAHAMVLAERTQSVVDVFSYDVPAAALGLPTCEAYAAHCFSVDALRRLVNPDQRVGFLEVLTAPLQEPLP